MRRPFIESYRLFALLKCIFSKDEVLTGMFYVVKRGHYYGEELDDFNSFLSEFDIIPNPKERITEKMEMLFQEAEKTGRANGCWQSRLTLEIKNKQGIKDWLDDYIRAYENGELYHETLNVQSLYHQFKEYEPLIRDTVNNFGCKNINIYIPANSDSKAISNRYLEFFLLMEKMGFIQIFQVGDNDNVSDFKWILRIDFLRDYKEIEELVFHWKTFGKLSFRPDSGHCNNGVLASHIFIKTGAPYRAMKLFMENYSREFSFKEIEEACYDDESPTKTALKNRINNLVDKQIRKPLKLNHPESTVNILGSDGRFKLCPIPSRV